MNWWEALHLALTAAIFVTVWIEGNDEPFWLRTLTAALVALFWLPLIIVTVIWVTGDWIGDKLKGPRK